MTTIQSEDATLKTATEPAQQVTAREDRWLRDAAKRSARLVAAGALKTGWPAPALAQDDDRPLSRWFASKPDARRRAREAAASIAEAGMGKTP